MDRLGVGVDRGAHLNVPSSLSGLPATEQANLEGIGRVPYTMLCPAHANR
jgi:hypothetical protein